MEEGEVLFRANLIIVSYLFLFGKKFGLGVCLGIVSIVRQNNGQLLNY